MIQQGLKYREVAKKLIAQAVLEFADFVGDETLPAKTLHHILPDLPIKRFDLGFVRQIEQSEREHVLGLFAAVRGVMHRLQPVELRQVFANVQEIAH